MNSCQKQNLSNNKSFSQSGSSFETISTTTDYSNINPSVLNGILKFENFEHVGQFVDNNDVVELATIYTAINFTNNNLSNSTLMDTTNLQHISYRILNNNNTIIIGDYLCRLDSNIYFITAPLSNYSNYSDFETGSFDVALMKRFTIFVERDSNFSLEAQMNSSLDVAETYTMPIDPSSQLLWKFWGKESGCHPPYKMPNPHADPNGPITFQCERNCWETTYRFGFNFGTRHYIEIVPCN